MAFLYLKSLGSLELEGPEGDLLPGRRKILALLAYLVRGGSRTVRRGELAALLWGDRPEARALSSLREALFQLRGALGEGLRTDRYSVRLEPGTVRMDLDELEKALGAGLHDQVMELWGGDFLPNMEDSGTPEFRSWIDGERAALRGMVSTALETLVREAEECGAWQRSLSWARRWAEVSPLDEAAQASHIRVLRLAGRGREAEEWAEEVRRRFQAEVGREPDLPGAVEPELSLPKPRGGRSRVGSAAIFTPDLVGREGHFAELVEAWARVTRGGAASILIGGDQGVGKTRLAGEFLGWISQEGGGLILPAKAYRAEAGKPYSGASSLLRGLIQAPGLSAAPDAAVAELSTLVPALRDRYPRLPQPTGEPEALFEGLRRVVEEVAAEIPLVLFLDDLGDADPQSRQLLLSLARHLPSSTLFIASVRSGDSSGTEVTRECNGSGMETLSLKPLDEEECGQMLASMVPLDESTRRELARLLHAESGGNPFFLEEILATLVDEGHLVVDERGVWNPARKLEEAPLPLPASVQDAIHRRLARLGPEAQEVLKAAAVLWPLVTPDLIAGATGLEEHRVSEGMDELVSRRLLRSGGDPPGSYGFAHDLLRRVAYEEVPWHRRKALHGAAVRLLAGRGGESPGVDKALQYHKEQGGDPHRLRRILWIWASGAAAVLVALSLLAGWLRPGKWGGEAMESPLVVIGQIREYAEEGDPPTASAVRDMLSTNLARVEGLRVVSTSRIYELAMRESVDPASSAGMSLAARAARADEVVEGSLYRREGDTWRLDLQRVDLATGLVHHIVTLEEEDVFGLVDRATAEVARKLGLTPPPLRLAQVSTNSLEAYRLYEEGLQAFHRGERDQSAALFSAALQEDTTFVMAEFYAGRSLMEQGEPEGVGHLQRAMRLADRVGERERLLIRGTWMDLLDEPAAAAYADSLLARFPHDPAGYYLRGRALLRKGDFLGAASVLRAAVAMDSASAAVPGIPCSACDAAAQAVAAYWMADSLVAAEAMAREWTRFQPQGAPPWTWLSAMLEHQERFEEALEARREAADRLTLPRLGDLTFPAVVEIKREDFGKADSLLLEQIRSGSEELSHAAQWLYVISLRWQGRLAEALEVAQDYRGPATGRDGGPLPNALLEAQVLFELGEFEHAAALFDSLGSTFSSPVSEGMSARQRSWMLTHSADASAEAGDTVRLGILADSIRSLGSRSGFGRDHLLHHHIRGLLFLARGDSSGARREFQEAIFSPNAGFTRTNMELARLEMAAGHPQRAIPLLQAIFRAPVDVSNFYLARTEARQLLGEAWLQANEPDSARFHLRRAAEAWRNADPLLQPRREAVLDALRKLAG